MAVVLVADDNRDAADMLAAVIEAYGHACHVAYDGHGAVAAASTYHPHLVILDINMPGMDGYQAAAALRQRMGAAVRIAALTGASPLETATKAKDSGFDRHYTKPISADQLSELLKVG